jgi:NCS1 family nucleobase:cation symporter-1
MVAVLMWIDTSVYVGPLSSRTNGADLSWALGIVVSSLLYAALAWKGVRNEARAAAGAADDDDQAAVVNAPPVAIYAAGETPLVGPEMSEA